MIVKVDQWEITSVGPTQLITQIIKSMASISTLYKVVYPSWIFNFDDNN